MPATKNILVPLDFTPHAMGALAYARTVAEKTGGTVHCAHVSQEGILKRDGAQELFPMRLKEGESEPPVQTQIEVLLREAVTEIACNGAKAVWHTRVGNPLEQMHKLIAEFDVDLLIMGTKGLSGPDRLVTGFPGSLYASLRQASPVPVLAIKPPGHDSGTCDSLPELKKVLCPCDLSEFSCSAIPLAAWWCRTFGATLVLAHVAKSYDEHAALNPNNSGSQVDTDIKSTGDRLEELASQQDVASREIVVAKGNYAETLAKIVIEHHIDLVVMATHGKSSIQNALFGSITEELLRTVECPLLTMHPAEVSVPDLSTSIV